MTTTSRHSPLPTDADALAGRVALAFAGVPEVLAIALGGSRGGGGIASDPGSDLDLEVYTRGGIPRAIRERVMLAAGAALPLPIDHAFWGAADEWPDPATGLVVDATYFDAAWMEDQIDRVLVRHEPSLGYSTCFWHTVRGSRALHDPHGWLAALQARADVPYPEPLRRNVVAHNLAVLRGFPSALELQVARAVARRDPVAVNHRVAALLASCFDIVFALNRVPHPGEKRLLVAVAGRCPVRPAQFEDEVRSVLAGAGTMDPALTAAVGRLVDGLEALAAGDPNLGAPDPEQAGG
jgi:hypothetical protein